MHPRAAHRLAPTLSISPRSPCVFFLVKPGNEDPEDIFVWLICSQDEDVLPLQPRIGFLRDRLREAMVAAGFPTPAIETVQTDVTSLKRIEKGGGRFYYFR